MTSATATKLAPEAADYDTILVERDGPAFIITMNRVEKYNALNLALRREVAQAMLSVRNDTSVRGVILWGGTRSFSSGADISEFNHGSPLGAYRGFATSQDDVFGDVIGRLPQPVIAAIGGPCFGGGLEVALICDFRIAAENALFGQPEVNVGLLPGGGATQRLTRMVGITKAKEMILLGRTVKAEEALQIGLVSQVVSTAQLLDEAKAIVRQLAEKAPLGVRLAKQMIDHGQDASLETGLMLESLAFAGLFTTEDLREGVTAFLAKRKPAFKGR